MKFTIEANGTSTPVEAKDLNGEALDLLTPALVAELSITLNIQTNE